MIPEQGRKVTAVMDQGLMFLKPDASSVLLTDAATVTNINPPAMARETFKGST